MDEREEAETQALQGMVDKVVKDPHPASLEPVKSALRKTKKHMRTRSYYLCDQCGVPIVNYDDGYIFHGNVYMANPTERGGLIGNNFPNVTPGTPIDVENVEENVFCHKCLVKILGLGKHYEPKKQQGKKSTNESDLIGDTGEEEMPVRPVSVATGRNGHGETGWRTPPVRGPGSRY